MTAMLALREKDLLDSCERIIERAKDEFASKASGALRAIRDKHLYRETHGTFEDYCEQRWGLSKRHVNRLIQAADVTNVLGPMGPELTSERQARELAPLLDQPDEMRDVWREANERTDGKPTAASIRDVRNERYPQTPRAQDELPDEARPVAQPVEDLGAPAPSVTPTRDLSDVLEERLPGSRADMQRTALSARWSKLMHAVAEFDLLDMDDVRSAIDDTEASLAIKTLRGVAERLEKAGRPGLRVVGGTDA